MHDKLIERWVKIYFEKRTKEGERQAYEWVLRTVNPEDMPRLRKAIFAFHKGSRK